MAIWSVFGYLVGLGDRHLENILICNKTSKICMIDLECVFNYGLKLPVPEIVDFRFTKNIRSGLGALKN